MFGFSRANIFLGNKDDSSNKDIFGATNSSETKKYVYDRSGKSSGNADSETVNLGNTEEMNTSNEKNNYDDSKYFTDEDLSWFIGKMSDSEYEEFVKKIENYYDGSINNYEQLLSNAEEVLNLLNDSKALEMSAIDNLDQNAIGGRKDEIMNQLYWFVQDKKYEGTGVTREELENMTDEERIQYIIKYDAEAKRLYDEWMKSKTEVADAYIKSKFSELGITNLDDYIKCRNTLIDQKQYLKEAIKTTKNLKQSAYYDNLKYLSDYNNYKEHEFTDEERDYVKKKSYTSPTMNDSYDYNDFHNKFPDTTPLDFVKLLQETHPSGNYTVTGIKDLQNLKTIANSCDKIPDLSKTYEYLYSQSPEKAGEYLKDIQYELNNVEGQLRAERFLSLLGKSDGNNDGLETIANELGVTVEGLTDGLESFGSGVGYSFEALLTSLGITEENRTMSAEEYKKMYILYGLMSEESKIKTGLVQKNDKGELENTNPNSIIDYTRKYSGGVTLSVNYEISQGIGNMLPSVMISSVCPMAGSVAMGVSAGGNAYHDAMVNGDCLFSSIMYGVFTGSSEAITEKILGGLPGLSDVQVTSLATYGKACAKEGFQESFQGVMDAVYKASFMGEELPTTLEGWKEFGMDTLKQGLYGAATAGIMQSPALRTSIYKKRTFNADIKKLGLTDADIDDALSSFRRSNDALANLSNDELIVNYGDQILRNVKDRLNVDSNGTYDASLRRFRKNSNDEYGGDQASLINKYKKNRKGDRAELEEIILAVKKDHPEFTDKDLELFFTNLNKGGCTYISATNIIFEQFGYDGDAFRSKFGFDMYDSKGNLNHDRLVADIYSYLSDKVEFNYTGQSKSYEFTSNAEAAQTLLGKTFSNDTDAFLALHDSGYIADGRSSSGNPIFTKFEQSQQTFFGTPSDIAYQITGEKVQLNSSLELKNYLDSKGIGGSFSLDSNNSTKLFSHGDGFEKWMGRYFNDRGIDLVINTFDMPTDGDYNSLVDNINLAIQNGYSINIAATSMQEISMTNGKLFGWTTIGGSSGDGQTGGVGHAMTFRGFDSNGDIQVSSWGEIYTIPKEYFDRLKIKAISLNGG